MYYGPHVGESTYGFSCVLWLATDNLNDDSDLDCDNPHFEAAFEATSPFWKFFFVRLYLRAFLRVLRERSRIIVYGTRGARTAPLYSHQTEKRWSWRRSFTVLTFSTHIGRNSGRRFQTFLELVFNSWVSCAPKDWADGSLADEQLLAKTFNRWTTRLH